MLARPPIVTVDDYRQCFTDADFWQPYVMALCERHGIACHQIQAGYPGTHIVFLVDDTYAIKLYSQFFNGMDSYQRERSIYSWLARFGDVPMPHLIASGFLLADAWRYPYIITQVIEGISLYSVLDDALTHNGQQIASDLGHLMRRLHELPLADDIPLLTANPAGWQAFMANQRQQVVTNHRNWQALPDHLIAQLDDYLARGAYGLWHDVVFIHADLNPEHIMGHYDGHQWQTSGIIDFGDGRIGDSLYDFIALYIGTFQRDKTLLKAFLSAYGTVPDGFVGRAMALTLLHEFNVFANFPDLSTINSLEQLAILLWDVNDSDTI